MGCYFFVLNRKASYSLKFKGGLFLTQMKQMGPGCVKMAPKYRKPGKCNVWIIWTLLRVVGLLCMCILSFCGTEVTSRRKKRALPWKQQCTITEKACQFQVFLPLQGVCFYFSGLPGDTYTSFQEIRNSNSCVIFFLLKSQFYFLRQCKISLCLMFSIKVTDL